MLEKEKREFTNTHENLKYYFTTHDHAISNIENNRIKVSLFSSINDIHELMGYNFNTDEKVSKIFQEMKEEIISYAGFISFSRKWTSSIMWGHYSENYKGICLGYNIIDEANNKISPIEYIKDKKDLPIDLSDLRNETEVTTKLFNSYKKNISRKSTDWKYEEEERLIVDLKNKDPKTGLYFTDSKNNIILKEIILGALSEFTPYDIGEFLQKIKYKFPVRIFKTKPCINTFSMEILPFNDYDSLLYTPKK